MALTPNLGLSTTDRTEGSKKFIDYRTEMSQNMEIIDEKVGELYPIFVQSDEPSMNRYLWIKPVTDE